MQQVCELLKKLHKNDKNLKQLCKTAWKIQQVYNLIKKSNEEENSMTAAKQFAADWNGEAYEKGYSQPFWLYLLRDVYGVEQSRAIYFV